MSLVLSAEDLFASIDSANPVCVLEDLKIGSFEVILASEQIKYPYVLYIPQNNPEIVTNIMMWGAGSISSDSPEQQAREVKERIPRSITIACERLQIACITPILPRDRSHDTSLDAQILSRGTMLPKFDCPEYYLRPDNEILKMLKQVKSTLQSNQYRIANKFIVAGISAGANQANRLSILYPGIIKASAVLSAGDYFYPEKSIQGQQIDYPFGIADISQINRQQFDLEAFKKIKHFFYIGKQDLKENRDPFLHDLNGNRELASRLAPVLGKNQVERGLNYVEYLRRLGVDLDLVFREDLGHSVDEDVLTKLSDFIKRVL